MSDTGFSSDGQGSANSSTSSDDDDNNNNSNKVFYVYDCHYPHNQGENGVGVGVTTDPNMAWRFFKAGGGTAMNNPPWKTGRVRKLSSKQYDKVVYGFIDESDNKQYLGGCRETEEGEFVSVNGRYQILVR